MDMTIGALKIGARLILGKYGVRNESPYPIVWLKGTPNSDFIAEQTIDYICFDSCERANNDRQMQYYGNGNYQLSNLLSFLNSDEETWYRPTHQADAPPSRQNVRSIDCEYESHYGFLYHFEDYEVDSIRHHSYPVANEHVTSMLRLPSSDDILGANRFKLFSKKGVRAKGTDDMVANRWRAGFDYNSYIDFWVSDAGNSAYSAKLISRSGCVDSAQPSNNSGLRPVCSLKPETVVSVDGNGLYYIAPRVIHRNVCTEEELCSFLGITQK